MDVFQLQHSVHERKVSTFQMLLFLLLGTRYALYVVQILVYSLYSILDTISQDTVLSSLCNLKDYEM